MLIPLLKEVNTKRFSLLKTPFFLALTVCFTLGLSSTSAYLISLAALQTSIGLLHVPIAGVRFFGIAKPFTNYFENYFAHNDMLIWISEVRLWFYRRFKSLSLAKIAQHSHGKFLKQITRDMGELELFAVSGILPQLSAFVSLLLISILLWFVNPLFVVGNFVIYFLLSYPLPFLLSFFTRRKRDSLDALYEKQNEEIYDAYGGLAELSFHASMKQKLLSRIDLLQKDVGRREAALSFWESFFKNTSKFLSYGFFLGLLLYSFRGLGNGSASPIRVVVTLIAYMTYIDLIDRLHASFFKIDSSSKSARNLIICTQEEPKKTSSDGVFILEKYIRFDDVCFSYPDTSRVLYNHFSLTIPAKTQTILTAESGFGKSTLFKFLLKYDEPQKGSIFIDDQALTHINPVSLYDNISYISQKTFLFSSTIRENLLLAKPHASDEELLYVLNFIGLDKLIQNREGLDTWIGESGNRLSGGEQQRLSLARAYLKDAPLLLLDEPTASLDWRNRDAIERLLDTLTKDKTLVRAEVNYSPKNSESVVFLDQLNTSSPGTFRT